MRLRNRSTNRQVIRRAGPERAGGGARRPSGRVLAAAAVVVLASLAGCSQMDAALGQQWVDVQLAPTTTASAARNIAAACSHVPNMKPYPIVKTSSYANLVGLLRFHATNATPAQMSRLQRCLQHFPAVQGFTLGQPGANS